MTLDDNLVKAVDRVSKELHTSRSAFTDGTRDVLHIFIFCLRNGFDYDSYIACQDSHD